MIRTSHITNLISRIANHISHIINTVSLILHPVSVDIFLETEENRPADEEVISDLQETVYVFCELEFPITQCAEQTYTLFYEHVPTSFLVGEIGTEYGEKIGIFHKSNFVEMKESITCNGLTVEPVLSPFGKYIFDYGI